jgi:hypothetical protein
MKEQLVNQWLKSHGLRPQNFALIALEQARATLDALGFSISVNKQIGSFSNRTGSLKGKSGRHRRDKPLSNRAKTRGVIRKRLMTPNIA